MIDSIDDAIASTAPRVARRDQELFGLVEKVVEERMPRRRRVRRRFVLGTAVFALVLGGTSVALATPDFQQWAWGGDAERTVERINPAGELCTMAFKVHAEGVPDTDPSVTAAREILAAIDFETLKIDPVVLEENRAQAAADLERRISLGLAKRGTQVDADYGTISQTVAELIGDGVRARGLVPHISIESGMLCGDDDGSRDDGN